MQHVRHQLGLLFQDKSDGEVKSAVWLYKSAVQMYKSADIKIHDKDFNISKVKLG